jgi:hypothetical protein
MNGKVTLDINPETVSYIVNMAREFHAKEQGADTGDNMNADEDWAMQTIADHADDPTFNELKIAIEDLEPDQQVQLVALMWVGRGNFSAEEWEGAVKEAGDNWNSNTADYLIGTPLVADYLQEGLNQLEYFSEDFEI